MLADLKAENWVPLTVGKKVVMMVSVVEKM